MSTDLDFLKEIKENLVAGIEGKDPTKTEFALQMIDDWIEELEEGSAKESSVEADTVQNADEWDFSHAEHCTCFVCRKRKGAA